MNDKRQKLDELIHRFTELDLELSQLLTKEYSRAGVEGWMILDLMPEETQRELKRLSREMDEVRKQGISLEEEIEAEEEK